MGMPFLPDHRLEVDVGSVVRRKPRIKGGGRLASSFADLLILQRALDDIGDRAILAPRQAVSQITRFGAAYGELGLSHGGLLSLPNDKLPALAIKLANVTWVAAQSDRGDGLRRRARGPGARTAHGTVPRIRADGRHGNK
jgi:hypothetical protein